MRTLSSSTRFVTATAATLAEPLPTPPQTLDDHAMRFWRPTIESKRREAWTESDLLAACQLCRDLAAIEILSEELSANGYIIETERGKRIANPAARLLDAATRRLMYLQKHLQIHSLGTNGKTDHQVQKNQVARDLAKKLNASDHLIARPAH